jgi:hypothetical protein
MAVIAAPQQTNNVAAFRSALKPISSALWASFPANAGNAHVRLLLSETAR